MFENNQGINVTLVGEELVHTNKEVVEIILYKYDTHLNHFLSFKDSISNS